MTKIEQYLLRLAYVSGISIRQRWQILDYMLCHSFSHLTAYELVEIAQIQKYRQLFIDSWKKIQEDGCKIFSDRRFFTCLSPVYPPQLLELAYPPTVLFYKGRLELLNSRKIAVVGARDAGVSGKQVVDQLLPELIAENYVIVSGGAQGIDCFSHQAAMRLGGGTIAVAGTGIDRYYPKEQAALQRQIGHSHLLLSEYPPDRGPRKHHFPMRNRLIAALAGSVCVIEAKERSGSLITAQQALELGREVFAVPGSVLNLRSVGCHQLIQDGAKCTYSAQDILTEFSRPDF